jgi:hypothetical protein
MSFAPTIRLDSAVDLQMTVTVLFAKATNLKLHLALLFVVECHFKLQTSKLKQ